MADDTKTILISQYALAINVLDRCGRLGQLVQLKVWMQVIAGLQWMLLFSSSFHFMGAVHTTQLCQVIGYPKCRLLPSSAFCYQISEPLIQNVNQATWTLNNYPWKEIGTIKEAGSVKQMLPFLMKTFDFSIPSGIEVVCFVPKPRRTIRLVSLALFCILHLHDVPPFWQPPLSLSSLYLPSDITHIIRMTTVYVVFQTTRIWIRFFQDNGLARDSNCIEPTISGTRKTLPEMPIGHGALRPYRSGS